MAPIETTVPKPDSSVAPAEPAPAKAEASRLRDLTPHQWKSGIAAWLGWLFDGLDMHLYILVATPFVASLLGVTDVKDPSVGRYSSIIQAAFLVGWALGGGFFGRVADKIGRSRALILTILVYAIFTGTSYFAQTWWQLMIMRFLAALGIGGEWAVGAALLSETWPSRWRPWMAAVLQSAVNIGVMLATVASYALAGFAPRTLFLVGVLPAFLVLWIRRAVPETDEWHGAKLQSGNAEPSFKELFQGSVRRTTLITLTVCGLGLTAHWAYMFWFQQHVRNLPDVASWSDKEKQRLVSMALLTVMIASIVGNFAAAWLARKLTYRRSISLLCFVYFLSIVTTYSAPHGLAVLWCAFILVGLSQGVFALFTMYLPPLFPTLLRTTGAGFCYNFGRIAAGIGTVVFGLFTKVGDYRLAIFYAGFLFLPTAAFAWLLPESPDERLPIPEVGPE